MHERKNSKNLQKFLYWIQSGFTHISNTVTWTDRYEARQNKHGISNAEIFNFWWNNHISFSISRKKNFKNLMWAFLFLTLTHRGEKLVPFKLASMGISQFVSECLKGIFLVYDLGVNLVSASGYCRLCSCWGCQGSVGD